jgi:EAL domain-containing protein (putative c-di-GMP-specific phosphodiesterase class I)
MNLYAPTRSPDNGAAHAEQCARIREGIRNGEFCLAWQPIVDVRQGMAVGAEALLRWQHPKHGLLLPGAFESSLHDPDVAWDVTTFAIDQIAANVASLSASGRQRFVSFNVYPSQLRDGRLKQLVETRYLARGGAPNALMIELLESEPHVACDELVANVKALRALGLTVAIDDLGSGAWKLTDLQRLEVDVVKLASELLCEIPSSDAAMKVLAGTLRILDALGTQAIVEGVETDEQAAWVATVPRLWAQGYAFSRPRPDLAGALGWTRSPAHAHC